MTSTLTDAFEGLLPAYLAGSLVEGERRAVGAHLQECDSCQASAREWEAVRSASHVAAEAVPAPSRGLLDRVWERIDEQPATPGWWERHRPAPLMRRSVAGAVAAAALVLAIGVTPIASFAEDLLQVMRPQQFTVVPVTRADLEALPLLARYGEFGQASGGSPHPAASAAEAAAATGMQVLVPSALPASVTSKPEYHVLPTHSATFTFRAAKAEEAARAQGATLPPMPANVDGSSLSMTTGNAVIAQYPEARAEGSLLGDRMPQLIVGQMQAPTATASGVPVPELRDYLLSQPGISNELRNAIRAIGDPTSTWPVPVPVGELKTRNVTVQGVRGIAFSEPSGFGSGVLWLKDGVVYGVAGPLAEAEVLRIANSLA